MPWWTRVRWNNVAKLAAVLAAIAVVAAWPRGHARTPRPTTPAPPVVVAPVEPAPGARRPKRKPPATAAAPMCRLGLG